MPHIIVKLWPGKSRQQKQKLADEITRSVTRVLAYGDESVSVGFEEVSAGDWMTEVYQPDIAAKQDSLFKKPGYGPLGGQS
ncbi:tautomerase family protein [Massilia sp. LXY-6]|uniref:tautomerase family protein n=1 Tax=Massilia sp. LXY-6 TaxID=3379823 RepID=UPI003EE2EA92